MVVVKMVKTKNLAISFGVISVCVLAIFSLLTSSTIPIFTVAELMDNSSSDKYQNKTIQLIGVISSFNGTDFYVNDPDDPNNTNYVMYIYAENVQKPVGFVIGKSVLIEGKLSSINNLWSLKASMISTKCPSKYDSDS